MNNGGDIKVMKNDKISRRRFITALPKESEHRIRLGNHTVRLATIKPTNREEKGSSSCEGKSGSSTTSRRSKSEASSDGGGGDGDGDGDGEAAVLLVFLPVVNLHKNKKEPGKSTSLKERFLDALITEAVKLPFALLLAFTAGIMSILTSVAIAALIYFLKLKT